VEEYTLRKRRFGGLDDSAEMPDLAQGSGA
jgi:hypothetical protein